MSYIGLHFPSVSRREVAATANRGSVIDVIATGETHSVREFVEIAFSHVGLDYEEYVQMDPRFLRPAEVELLIGDASKAKEKLGWSYDVSFKDLVIEMVEADLKLFSPSR